MDAARCPLRLRRQRAAEQGADPGEVHVVYRRSREEVPARAEEVEHAEEESVRFDFLTNPLEILGDEQGRVQAMRCIRMALGEPDDSDRRRPVPVEGSEFEMPVDTVIFALGTSPNPLVFVDAEGLERRRQGTVVADERTAGPPCPGSGRAGTWSPAPPPWSAPWAPASAPPPTSTPSCAARVIPGRPGRGDAPSPGSMMRSDAAAGSLRRLRRASLSQK
jgi:hypothetical protein